MDILIVDDDRADREHLRRTLKRNDAECRIVEALTVEEGLERFREQAFDVILLDYRMPKRDGIEMLLELRSEPKENSTAIVMMSTSEEEQLALDCLHAGAQDFLVKSDITSARLGRAILNAQTRFELEKKLYHSYQKVKQLAEQDNLTGLANRYLFDESLKFILANTKRGEQKLALLFIDLDNFKYVNDAHGHDVGDDLLKKVVTRIQGDLRNNELFARLGGDEFGIILNNLTHIQDASRVAQRIISSLAQPFRLNDTQVKSGASIGIAIYPDNGKTAKELFKFADIAMYRAKKLGRNQVCFFEGQMQKQFSVRYKIETKLRNALANNEFTLNYQPVINPKLNRLEGFEALIRWKMNGEQLSPEVFIPIAESCGLIIAIGRWTIDEALGQLASWKKISKASLTMAINLSAAQLTDTNLPKFIKKQLKKHNINAREIEFELTETALLDSSQNKFETINKIHDLGCRIALDDFGTGYSSVSHLQNFPISTVKIDKSLMPSATSNKKELSLIRSLAVMIQSLGLDISGEGVESKQHADLCCELNIEKAQGYYFDKALPIKEIEAKYLS
ncbi:MAG: EAL domain-containing protein [Porticoccaceae bacterium]|nr:EAL domain-containing protein [Porticoccaceae bacterium]